MSRRKNTRLNQIGLALGRAFNAYDLMLARHMKRCAVQEHVRPGQGSLLFALFEQDGQTPTELARRLHLSKPTVTRIIARMKRQGLLVTKPDPVDGRSQRVLVTPMARSIEPDCRNLADNVEEILSRKFTKGERGIFGELMERLIEAITEEHMRLDGLDQSI